MEGKRKRLSGRKKHYLQATGGVPENKIACTVCGKFVVKASLTHHLAQCKKRKSEEANNSTVVARKEDEDTACRWMYETIDDEGDPGFLGVEDCASTQDKETFEDPRDVAPPELLLAVNDSTPLGRLVKVSKFKANWMSLGKTSVDDDTDDTDDETLDEEKEEGMKEVNCVEGTTPAEVTKEDDEDSIGAVVRESEVLETTYDLELEEKYRNISSRDDFSVETGWSVCKKDSLGSNIGPILKETLNSETGDTLGLCVRVDYDRKEPPPLEKNVLSMVRLIQYCNLKSNSRGFVDGFLDLIAEEMSIRGFDPRKRPSRDFVSKQIMTLYGGGCAPEVRHVTVADEGMVVSAQEERKHTEDTYDSDEELVDVEPGAISRSDAYKAIPREIDNRKRYIVDVICFSTRNMILDLLSDTNIFGCISNLVVNESNPFLPYRNTNGVYDELLDGSWYGDTVGRLKAFPEDPFCEELEFLLPLVMYVDKTGTSINQRYPLEPFILTTAIIKRQLRNLPTSWRPLGFIPDLETKSSAEAEFVNNLTFPAHIF